MPIGSLCPVVAAVWWWLGGVVGWSGSSSSACRPFFLVGVGRCVDGQIISLGHRSSRLVVCFVVSVARSFRRFGCHVDICGEFDSGSGRTLAACLTHASRTDHGGLPLWLVANG